MRKSYRKRILRAKDYEKNLCHMGGLRFVNPPYKSLNG